MRALPKGTLSGYLVIHVRGYGVERFFRLCAGRDIMLWNLRQIGSDSYECCICMHDFAALRPVCRKTKTRVRILRRQGLPAYLARWRKRFVFFAAFVGMLCGIYWCSNYVWNIEITGNSYLSDENLLRFLKEQGITAGVGRSKIDTDALELLLRQSYAQITWTSVCVDGTSLVICVKEQMKTDERVSTSISEEGTEGASDIVAAKNATIASIITRLGTPCVVSGDEVLAGDMLVSAQCDIYNDDGEVRYSLYQQADADVYGYVEYTFGESLPIQSLIEIDTDEVSTAYFVRIFQRYLIFPYSKSPYEEYYSIDKFHQLKLLDNFYLPVCWGTRDYVKRESAYYLLAKEAAEQTAEEDFLSFVQELEENGVSIIDKNVMIEDAGNEYEVSGHVLALEPIGVSSPIEIPLVLEEEQQFDEYD